MQPVRENVAFLNAVKMHKELSFFAFTKSGTLKRRNLKKVLSQQ
jgi:hypothetical protein